MNRIKTLIKNFLSKIEIIRINDIVELKNNNQTEYFIIEKKLELAPKSRYYNYLVRSTDDNSLWIFRRDSLIKYKK